MGFIHFGLRMEIEELYLKWCEEEGVANEPNSFVVFMMLKGWLNEEKIIEDLDHKTENSSEIPNNFDKDTNVRSKDEPKLSEIPTSKCHYEPKDEPQTDGILFKGNLKEGDYKLIKTSNGWVLEGNDIAYCGEPQTERKDK